MADRVLRVHVERTASPTVLRWVCHRPDLDATPVAPGGSALDALVRDGTLEGVAAVDGDVVVQFTEPHAIEDRDLVAAVHHAVTEALALDGWTAPSGVSEVAIRRSHGPHR